MTARAITSQELTKLRGRQSSRLYLALHQPQVVYTAQVNQTVFEPEVDAVAYDNGSGTPGNVLPGMTVLIGTTAGAADVGVARVRKTPTSSTLYLGKIGGIQWQDNLYLTILREFRIWPVPVSYLEGATVLDEDVAYSDQHTNYTPVVNLGPTAVLWLDGASVTFSPSASGSWVFDSTISGYNWTAPGASATQDMNTANPQITYNAAGQYMIGCTVTAANGKTATGWRPVFVFGGAVQPLAVKSLLHCAGEVERGGWAAEVEVVELGNLVVRDGTLAVLFSVDEWEGVVESVGVPNGYGNILMVGWVNGDSIVTQRGYGTVRLQIDGTTEMLAKINSLPGVIRKSSDTPNGWDEFGLTTVTRALWHLLTERSTAGVCTDIYLENDGRRLPAIDLSGGTLWEQIQKVCGYAQYTLCSNRVGGIFGGIEPHLRTTSQRSGIPVVMDITRADIAGGMTINEESERVGLLEIKGIRDDTPEETLISRAPGYLPRAGGDWRTLDGLVFDNQSHANFLSGQMLAVMNNRFEVDLMLGMNNRFFDICPAQYATLTIDASDTSNRVTFNAAKFFPKRVEFVIENGSVRTKLLLDKEVFGAPGVTIIPETEAGDENIITPSPPRLNYPLFPPPRTDWPEYAPPPVEAVSDCLTGDTFTGPYILTPTTRVLDTEGETQTELYIPCKLRDGTVNHKSMIAITGYMRYQAGGIWYASNVLSDWTVEALDANGNVVAVGANSFGSVAGLTARVSKFYPVGAQQIDKLRIKLAGVVAGVGNWSRTWNAYYGWGGWRPADTTTTIDHDIYVDPVTDEWVVLRHVQTYWRIQDGKIGLKRDVPPHYTFSRMVYEFPKNTIKIIGGISKTTVMYPQDWQYAATLYHLLSHHDMQPHSAQIYLWDGTVKTRYWNSWDTGYVERLTINCNASNWWEVSAVILEDYECAVQRYQWIIQGVYLYNVCPL